MGETHEGSPLGNPIGEFHEGIPCDVTRWRSTVNSYTAVAQKPVPRKVFVERPDCYLSNEHSNDVVIREHVQQRYGFA